MPSIAQIDEPVLTGFRLPLMKAGENDIFQKDFVKNNNNKHHINDTAVDNLKNCEKNGNVIENGYNGYHNGNLNGTANGVSFTSSVLSVVIKYFLS